MSDSKMRVLPISPNAVVDPLAEPMPDATIEAVNALISSTYADGAAVIFQHELTSAMMVGGVKFRGKLPLWLGRLCDVYRAVGWTVKVEHWDAGDSFPFPRMVTFTKS